MTAARSVRRKATARARRSSVRNVPACVVASDPRLSARARLPLNAFAAQPDVSHRPQTAGPACSSPLNPPPPCRPRRSNPHRARCAGAAPLPAISCLGASRTPPVGACGCGRHAGVRETLYGAFRVKGLFLALRGRQGSFVCSHRLKPAPISRPPSLLLFDPAGGLLPPRPGIATADARRRCQGWPHSGHRRLGLYIGEHVGMLVASGRLLLLVVPRSRQLRARFRLDVVGINGIEGSPHRGERDRAGNLVFGGSLGSGP